MFNFCSFEHKWTHFHYTGFELASIMISRSRHGITIIWVSEKNLSCSLWAVFLRHFDIAKKKTKWTELYLSLSRKGFAAFIIRLNTRPGGGADSAPPKDFFAYLAREAREIRNFWQSFRKMNSASNKKIIFEIGQNLAELQRLKLKLRISIS